MPNLKRQIFLKTFLLLFIFYNLLHSGQESIIENFREGILLKIEASISPARLSRGQEGKLVLKLTLEEEVALSPHPSFTIELNSCDELIFPKNFFSATDLEIETQEENGKEFLELKEAIEIPFTVTLDAEKGDHLLEGKVKYFAYSREENWCLKNSVIFSASFYTRSRTIKNQ